MPQITELHTATPQMKEDDEGGRARVAMKEHKCVQREVDDMKDQRERMGGC